MLESTCWNGEGFDAGGSRALAGDLFPHCPRATLIKWHNRHDTCLRADRGALTQMDWPSFKAAQQRSARRQVSPNPLIHI